MKTEVFINLLLSSVIFGFPRTFPVQMYTRIKRLFKKKKQNTDFPKNADIDYDNPEEVQLENDFQRACQVVAELNNLSIEQSLIFYGLYKQTLVGNCNKPKPNGSDMAELKKWEAWSDCIGLTKTQAKTEYINIVETLKPGFRLQSENKVKKELDDDDLFMTDEEYKQKKDVGSQNLGLKFSRPVMGGDLAEVKERVDEDDDVQKFFNLIDEEDIDQLKDMILSGFDLTKENGAGMKAIHYAIENEKDTVIELLCEHYEDLDIGDEAGMTPLHYAVTHENETAIELLLKKHVDINKTDNDGESPMDIAPNRIKKLIEGHLQA